MPEIAVNLKQWLAMVLFPFDGNYFTHLSRDINEQCFII